MAETPLAASGHPPPRFGWRLALLWLLTLALVGYALTDDDVEIDVRSPATAGTTDVRGDKLRIIDLDPVEVHAGAAVVVTVDGADPAVAIRARLDDTWLTVLDEAPGRIVVAIPRQIDARRGKLRVAQGDRESKPRDLHIRTLKSHKLVKHVLGGLALFVLGLRLLASGLRRHAGQGLRSTVGQLTQSRLRALGLGVVMGGITQTTTTTMGIVVGFMESRLLGLSAAVVLVLGAQLGSALTVLVLPLGGARESLFVISIGVAWLSFARDRRGTGLGEGIVGLGLMFYGLGLLRTGLQSTIADPEILGWLAYLGMGGAPGLLARATIGVALGALLQGPGPVFGLVLGLGETTAVLEVEDALGILVFTPFGVALGGLVVAWPYGSTARRLALSHMMLGGLTALAGLLLAHASAQLADVVIRGDPTTLAFGKKTLVPHFGGHLAGAWALGQIVATLGALVAVPAVVQVSQRLVRARRQSPLARTPTSETASRARARLAQDLDADRAALDSTLSLLCTGERSLAGAGDRAISAARTDVKALVRELSGSAEPSSSFHGLRAAAVAVLQLQQALEQLQGLAERALEKNTQIGPADREGLERLHDLVRTSLSAAITGLREGVDLDLEQARAREIRLNGHEARLRGLAIRGLADPTCDVRSRLLLTEIFGAYEALGDHIYRIAEALADPDDGDGA